jgi:hypothetical protein
MVEHRWIEIEYMNICAHADRYLSCVLADDSAPYDHHPRWGNPRYSTDQNARATVNSFQSRGPSLHS